MTEIKRWLIGITGGIAAYKTPELVRLLKKQGSEVRVVLSQGAKAFVTPLTLQAVSANAVYSELLDTDFEAAMGHIELARWAQGVLIAPLSANRLAALAHGFADDLLTTLCLATKAPIYVAPAMNQQMWQHPATQANLELLKTRGVSILGPDWGLQACAEVGYGRMLEPVAIVQALFKGAVDQSILPLQGLHILITAGPTREAIDPVRYLSNRSSGKMGIALAQAAIDLGAEVTLVHGPIQQKLPEASHAIAVTSASEMLAAVESKIPIADIFISAAAVADFRPVEQATQKIKKGQQTWELTLIPNPDILAIVAARLNRPFCVGFAAETEQFENHAKKKLIDKQIDLIALNDVSRADIGFDSDENAMTVLSHTAIHHLSKESKYQVAVKLLYLISEYYDAKNKT